jgi:hypothetical protein
MRASQRMSTTAFLVLGVGVLAIALSAPFAHAQTAPPAAATVDGILKRVALYDGGIDSSAVWNLRDYVLARKHDPAGRA